METSDISQVAALCSALGYPTDRSAVERRYRTLCARPDNAVFVATACDQDAVICGWVHVHGVRLLETDGYADIGGIVVSPTYRRRGVGLRLLRASETWARAHGYDQLCLRSGVHRDTAHAFYRAAGYDQAQASYMFRRELPG